MAGRHSAMLWMVCCLTPGAGADLNTTVVTQLQVHGQAASQRPSSPAASFDTVAQLGKGMCAPQAVSAACSPAGVAGAPTAATAALLQGDFQVCLLLVACSSLSNVGSGEQVTSHTLPWALSACVMWPRTAAGAEGAAAWRAVRRHAGPHDVAPVHQQPATGHACQAQLGRDAGINSDAQDPSHEAAGGCCAALVAHAPTLWPAPDSLASALVGVRHARHL